MTLNTIHTKLEHTAIEIDSDMEFLELHVSDLMEFETDDEEALPKAIQLVFHSATRYLCTKNSVCKTCY